MATTKVVISVTIDKLNVHSKLKVTGFFNITSSALVNGKLRVTSLASRIVESAGGITSKEIKGNTFKSRPAIYDPFRLHVAPLYFVHVLIYNKMESLRERFKVTISIPYMVYIPDVS